MKKVLSNNPQNIAPDVWYYEELKGLWIYFGQDGKAGQLIGIIPWKKVAHSLIRYWATKGFVSILRPIKKK